MHTIEEAEFKTHCLTLMDKVEITGEPWIITKEGRPIAELHPYSGARAASPFGLHPSLKINGDVVSPLDENIWNAST
jgi:antitoxin (DNA-binding transcriptional repressor) of toxin-antitoxin stability system